MMMQIFFLHQLLKRHVLRFDSSSQLLSIKLYFYLFQCCLLMMVTMLFIRATVVLLTWYFRTSTEIAKYCSPAVSLLIVVRCFTDILIHFRERRTPISSHINVSAFLRDWSFTATKLDFTWDFIYLFFFLGKISRNHVRSIFRKRDKWMISGGLLF